MKQGSKHLALMLTATATVCHSLFSITDLVRFPSQLPGSRPPEGTRAQLVRLCTHPHPHLCERHGKPSGRGENYTPSTASRTEKVNTPPTLRASMDTVPGTAPLP